MAPKSTIPENVSLEERGKPLHWVCFASVFNPTSEQLDGLRFLRACQELSPVRLRRALVAGTLRAGPFRIEIAEELLKRIAGAFDLRCSLIPASPHERQPWKQTVWSVNGH